MNDLDLCLEVVSRSFDIERGLDSKGPPIRNGIWAIKWSRDRCHRVTLTGQTLTPIRLQCNISKTA